MQENARKSGELVGGAKINHIFRTTYYETLQALDACAGLGDADIAHAIRQATGPRSPLFVPEASFEMLARRQIERLRPSCLAAVDQVLSEMQRLVPVCLPPQVQRYPSLTGKMQQCGRRCLARREKAASEMVTSLIEMELSYLNTSHPDFVGGSQAMRLIAQQLHAAADEQQYRAESEQLAPPTAAQAVSAQAYNGAPPPPPPPQSGLADPLAPDDDDEGGGDTFLNSFFGSGSSKRSDGGSASKSGLSLPSMPANPFQTPPPPPASSPASAMRANGTREQLETDIIRSLLVSYYGIVRKNLQDSVPKAIMHFLVNAVRGNIQNELVAELYKEGEFDEMLKETDDAVRRRKDCAALVGALERAQRVVDEMRSMDANALDSL